MRVLTVPEPVWRPILTQSFAEAGRAAATGYATLRACQADGCGLPIQAAFSFAAWTRGVSRERKLWEQPAAFVAGLARKPIQTVQDWLRDEPVLALEIFLLPMARHATQRLGQTLYYSTRQDLETDIAAAGHQNFRTAFEAAWQETWTGDSASSLRMTISAGILQNWATADNARSNVRKPRPDNAPPARATDTGALEMFLTAPIRSVDLFARTPQPDLAQVSELRVGRKPQQDGVTGIRHASAGEDPSAMLVSQWTVSDELLIDRIMNEGFLAYDRPTTSEQPRSLLFLQLLINLDEREAASVTRAAWWLATLRLGSHRVRKISVGAAGTTADRPDGDLSSCAKLGPAIMPFRPADRMRALTIFAPAVQPFGALRKPVFEPASTTADQSSVPSDKLASEAVTRAFAQLDLRFDSFDDVHVTAITSSSTDASRTLSALNKVIDRSVAGRTTIDNIGVSGRGAPVSIDYNASGETAVRLQPRGNETTLQLAGRLSDRMWARLLGWVGHGR